MHVDPNACLYQYSTAKGTCKKDGLVSYISPYVLQCRNTPSLKYS